MTTIRGGVVIGRPMDVVFDMVADQRNEPAYKPVMTYSERLTDGPIDVGTQFRSTTTTQGRPVEMLAEYRAYDRPRVLAFTTGIATADIPGAIMFSPHPSGTRTRWWWEVTPRGALRLLAPIIALAGRRQERRIWTGLGSNWRPRPHHDQARRDRQRKRVNTVMVLLAYASKRGATRRIAERIAATLTASGQPAVARPVDTVDEVAGDNAFVFRGAAYYARWLKPGRKFVRAHACALAGRPVWLFSSGPLGTGTDAQGRDLREAARPTELGELSEATGARGHGVFFGVVDPDGTTLPERAVWRLPAGGDLLAEGDFRDWEDIDGWARGIARELRSSGARLDPAGDSRAWGVSS